MLRALLVLLLLANAFWWAASHGWLPRAWLPLPDDEAQREPQRLAQQVRPEAITVLPAAPGRTASSPATAAAPAGTTCLQSPPLAADLLPAAEAALQAAGIAPGRWQRSSTDGGTVLRVDDASSAEQEALRAAAALAASGAAFSGCP